MYTDGAAVYKIFAPREAHLARLEAQNLARAGLGGWVLGVEEAEGHGVLKMRRFPGKPFAPEAFSPLVLARLGALFLHLHRLPEAGRVTAEELGRRLETFLEGLAHVPEAKGLAQALLKEVPWVAGAERRFCHRDAWAGNLLVDPKAQEVLLVDWARAGGDDPARDLALLKTGSLDLLGEEGARAALGRLARLYPKEVRERLWFYVPLTYLHDLYWFWTKARLGFQEALKDKLPRALAFFREGRPG